MLMAYMCTTVMLNVGTVGHGLWDNVRSAHLPVAELLVLLGV